MCNFQLLVRLLFKCGFYLRAANMQNPESAKPVKAVKCTCIMTLWWFQNHFNVIKHLACEKRGFSSISTTLGRFFKPRLLYECGLCVTWVRGKCSLYSSVASIQVRFNTTSFFKYGTCIGVVPGVCSASSRNDSLSLSLWACTRWTVRCVIAMHIHVWFTQKVRLDRLINSDISIRLIVALSINRFFGQIVTALVIIIDFEQGEFTKKNPHHYYSL